MFFQNGSIELFSSTIGPKFKVRGNMLQLQTAITIYQTNNWLMFGYTAIVIAIVAVLFAYLLNPKSESKNIITHS